MTDINTLIKLYKSCFPYIIRDEHTVRSILRDSENHIITEELDNAVIGVAVINQNTILMLCVRPELRGKGFGSRLLALAEEYIRADGFDEVKFCDGKDYITPGVPCVGPYATNIEFLKKRGYKHSWDNAECVDMMMDLSTFNATDKVVGDTVDGVLYKWADASDYDNVLECVGAGCEEFTKYYSDKKLYADDASSGAGSLVSGGPSLELLEELGLIGNDAGDLLEKPLIAIKDNKVCGALLVSNGTDAKGFGSVGCTVTHPDYRRQGIATNMVKLGTHYLQSLGLKRAFLGYTYTDIVPMYAKSGYKICMKYFMGVKTI